MATRRMICSNIWEDDFVGSLSFFERLLWIGLFSRCADDQGRLLDNPVVIRSQVFPYDDLDAGQIEAALVHFEREDKIIRYSIKGRRFVQLTKWWQNQKLQWAGESKYQGPAGWTDRVCIKEPSGKTVERTITYEEDSQQGSQEATQEGSQQGGEFSLVKSSLSIAAAPQIDWPDLGDLEPEPEPKLPCVRDIQNSKLAELEDFFSQRSGLAKLKRDTEKQRKSGGKLWWNPLREMLELVEWDVSRARSIVGLAINNMRRDHLTLSNPNSALNVYRALLAEGVAAGNNGHNCVTVEV